MLTPRRLFVAVATVLASALAFLALRPPALPSVAPPYPPTPLASCPQTSNCVLSSRAFGMDAVALFRQAESALFSMHPASVEALPDTSFRLHAVFRVFLFEDDVDLAVVPHADGAVLYLRSASRVGQGDLGVNGRRVHRFWKALEQQQ